MEINDIAVRRLMTDELVTVSPDTPVQEAGKLLMEHDIGSLVVVDADDQLAGIVTSTDFLDIVTGEHAAADRTVEEYMSTSVATVGPDDPMRDAAAKMISDGVQHLPVESEDGVVGMLSTTDLTAHLSYLDLEYH